MTVALPRLLIVGLGNLPYPGTRHSVGHLIIDSLSSHLGIPVTPNRTMGGYFGHGTVQIGQYSVALSLLKPKPLMNITGPAVAAALRATVKSPSHMVVIHDSLEHQPFKLHFKEKGSAAGHNGIKSVITSLGGDSNFPRFRVGIGRGSPGEDTARYVLGPLSSEEKRFWSERGEGLSLVLKEIERVLRKNTSSS